MNIRVEILNSLTAACRNCRNAIYSGTRAHALTEGYSSIDACFSALVYASGANASEQQFRNHKVKLLWVKEKYPNLFQSKDGLTLTTHVINHVTWEEIEAYYRLWLQARYSRIELSVYQSSDKIKQAEFIYQTVCCSIADAHDISYHALRERIEFSAFGGVDDTVNRAVSNAIADYEKAFTDRIVERGGSKIVAALNPVLHTNLAFTTDDPATQEILQTDPVIAKYALDSHSAFLNVIKRIQHLRVNEPTMSGTNLEPNLFMDFVLSLNIKFHGGSVDEISEGISAIQFSQVARHLVNEEDRSTV